MSRQTLIAQLEAYNPFDDHEKEMVKTTISFVEAHSDCFERSLLEGHVTASAWVVNPSGTHVLMIHHRKLDKWLQPGGHCDGDSDTLRVAIKEVQEETGVEILSSKSEVFDVDVHPIPERKGVPAHLHYDIRYLLVGNQEAAPLGNAESLAVKWIPLDEVEKYNGDESVIRLARKSLL